MADIELVVRMPEELYEANRMGLVAEQIWNLRVAINDGTLLPKGHGRLIDADKLKAHIPTIEDEYYKCRCMIERAPTIIEADGGA